MRRPPIDLGSATALVTGAGSGIGRATALALAARGATVLCTDIDLASAEKTAAACAEGAPNPSAAYEAAQLNVADRAAMDTLATAVARTHGPLHILVNNAGIGMTGPFEAMTSDEWAAIRSVNLDGVVHGCAVFGTAMLAAGRGHVVNVSSGLAFITTSGESAYGATKAAVLQLSQSLRAAWAAQGVGVSAVCPGFVNTDIARTTRFTGGRDDAARRDQLVKGFARAHPPSMVADAIVRAVERNKAVVPVGFESVLGWYVHRLAPIGLQQFVARTEHRVRTRR
jgi:NAD(P)-dependent dehydrogenase (short-subunit alcohol dehydrogenase family)